MPPRDPKRKGNLTDSVFWRSSKEGPKKGFSPGSGKVRSGCYLLRFSKVGGLKKAAFGEPCWGHLGDNIIEKKGPDK